jgi:hypothetical protein
VNLMGRARAAKGRFGGMVTWEDLHKAAALASARPPGTTRPRSRQILPGYNATLAAAGPRVFAQNLVTFESPVSAEPHLIAYQSYQGAQLVVIVEARDGALVGGPRATADTLTTLGFAGTPVQLLVRQQDSVPPGQGLDAWAAEFAAAHRATVHLSVGGHVEEQGVVPSDDWRLFQPSFAPPYAPSPDVPEPEDSAGGHPRPTGMRRCTETLSAGIRWSA